MSQDLSVRITATDGASAVFAKVGSSAKTMGSAVQQAGKSGSGLKTISQAIKNVEKDVITVGQTLTGIGIAGVAAFGLAAHSSIQFGASMANVNSIARLSSQEMSSLETSILSMATQFGAMPTDLSAGLYDIVSSGFEASEALGVLEDSTVAAGAGLTTTAVSAKAITAVLNAYGLAASESGNVSDVLFRIVESGVVTFEALANNMGTVLPTASSLGVEITELGAAYAELTLQGQSVSAAETSIAALMRSALGPTTALKEAIQEYGYASAEALIQAEGFAGYLQFLDEASGGSSTKLLELVGSQEALTAAQNLSADSAGAYIAQLEGMNAAQQDGAYTLDVFGVQMDTTAGSIQRLQAQLSVAAINMGSALEPLIQGGVDVSSGLVTAFNSLSPAMQDTITQLGALGSVATLAFGGLLLMIPRLLALGSAITSIRAAMTAAGGARLALTGMLGAINPAALALTALGLAGIYAWNVFRDGREASQGLEDALISLGDVAQNLRLGHRDEEAGFVDAFRKDIEEATAAADDFVNNVDFKIYDATNRRIAQTGEDYQTAYAAIREEFRLSTKESENFAAAQVEIGAMFANSQINAYELNRSLDHQRMLLDTGAITFDQYAENIKWFTENQDKFRLGQDASTESAAANEQAMLQEAAAADELAKSMQEVLDRLLAVSGVDDPLSRLNLSAASTYASYFADHVVDAGTALDTVFRVVVGNTNAFASQTQAVADWADELIGIKGEYAAIDDLLSAGVITLDQYNAAQQAQIEIATANTSVQQSVLALQASQAPLIAEHTTALATQLDLIRQMPADVQLVALGWMDATTAARAMEFQSLAVAVANGELGASGADAFTAMITGAAQADPVLKALLIDLGLISEVDGKMTVSLDGAEGAISDLDRLNRTIGDLIDKLDNGVIDGSYVLNMDAEDNATPVIDDVSTTLQKLLALGDGGGNIKLRIETATGGKIDYPDVQTGSGDGTGGPKPRNNGAASIPQDQEVNVVFNAIDNASPTLDALIADMAWYDGTEATARLAAEDLASGIIDAASHALDMVNGKQSYMDIGAIDSASQVIISASALLDAKNGVSATMQVLGNNADALGKITSASASLASVNGTSALMRVVGNNADALDKISQIQGYDGVLLSTAYHKIQTIRENIFRTVKQNFGGRAHGGIIPDLDHFASGGLVPFRAAENGPEVAHFATGGTALLPSEGVYAAPPGTYISPHNAVSTSYGGITVQFNGNFYGSNRAELDEWARTDLIPEFIAVIDERRRGHGAAA